MGEHACHYVCNGEKLQTSLDEWQFYPKVLKTAIWWGVSELVVTVNSPTRRKAKNASVSIASRSVAS